MFHATCSFPSDLLYTRHWGANFDPFATITISDVFNSVVTDLEFGVRTLRRLDPVLNSLMSSFRHLRSPVLRPPVVCHIVIMMYGAQARKAGTGTARPLFLIARCPDASSPDKPDATGPRARGPYRTESHQQIEDIIVRQRGSHGFGTTRYKLIST